MSFLTPGLQCRALTRFGGDL